MYGASKPNRFIKTTFLELSSDTKMKVFGQELPKKRIFEFNACFMCK